MNKGVEIFKIVSEWVDIQVKTSDCTILGVIIANSPSLLLATLHDTIQINYNSNTKYLIENLCIGDIINIQSILLLIRRL
jgi:hypothetical protein